MESKWEFLEPWRTVVHDCRMRETNDIPESSLDVSFIVPGRRRALETNIFLELPVNEDGRQDAGRLQQLREAMELFTLLSVVKNKAFQELLLSPMEFQPDYYLRWTIRLVGNLSSSNAAAAQTQATWGAFLGFSDGPWENSPEYRAAVQKLEAMGLKESCEAFSCSKSTIRWNCRLLDAFVNGRQGPDNLADISRSFRVQLRRLFDTVVPPIVRVFATRGCATLVNTSFPTNKPCSIVTAKVRNWAHPSILESTLALARTATACLRLNLEDATIYSRRGRLQAGYLLSNLVSGKALRLVTSNCHDSPPDRIPINFGKLSLWCSEVCNWMFRSVCSAVADSPAEVDLTVDSVRSERWPWLIYALCCGSFATEVSISWSALTKSDLLAISAVLQTHYPQPILDSNEKGSHAYGFVDIQEETELHPRGLDEDNDSGFVLSSGCRCRAIYDTNDNVSWVNCVLPGYGICKAQLGEGVRFTPDSGKRVFPEKRLYGSLKLYHVTCESTVLMEFLTLVASGLRSLNLITAFSTDEENVASTAIDLCALSMACPELQHLNTRDFSVVVSAHDESLRRWPIKTIKIRDCTGPMSDLTKWLRNPTLRMARQLVELEVTVRKNVLDEEGMRELKAHDGEFLPITKEKLPDKAKAAMLSVVASASCTTKPIYRLDAYILSLIFTFASIPGRRSVKCEVAR